MAQTKEKLKQQRKDERKSKKKARKTQATAAPVVQLVPAPRAEPSMKISYEAIGALRARGRNHPPSLFTTTEQYDPSVFRPAKPPPGVVPKDVQPMAMDEDIGAMWSGYGSTYSENLHWLGFPFLAELSQRAEYRQITETLAKEMTRRWIRVSATGDGDHSKAVAEVEDALKKHKIREKFRRLAELDGFFGRGHLYVDTGITGDRDLLKTALVLDKKLNAAGFLRGFRVVEPAWSYPGSYNAMDPLAEDFYRPNSWYVFGKEVHRSRFITLVSRELPDMLKPAYAFGGMSMSQLAMPYVNNWLRTRQSVSDLVHSFSVSGIKTDMSSVLMGGGADQVMLRAEAFSAARDNLGTMLLDKEKEEFFNVSTPLGTLDHLQAQSQEQMAAVSHTPLIILLGITPSGLNASSEGELAAWSAWVRASQEHLFDEPLRFVLRAVQLDMWGEINPHIDFDYEPLRELSDLEEATARKSDADVDALYVNTGVLSPDEIRQKLAADPDAPYAGIDLSGPPPEPETDPLGAPPDAPGGAPSASATRASGNFDGAPTDALGAVAAAIAARRADAGYEHWWDDGNTSKLDDVAAAIADRQDTDGQRDYVKSTWQQAGDAEFKEGDHPRDDDGKFGSGSGGGSEPRPFDAFALASEPVAWTKNQRKNAELAAALLQKHGIKNAGTTNPSGRKTDKRFAAIGSPTNGILVNPSSPYWKDPVASGKLNFDNGHLSTDNPMGILLHEVAHTIYDPQGYWMVDTHKATAAKVSKYAATNPKEFVSEVYAGINTGKAYDDSVMNLFKTYSRRKHGENE